ncbi:hypothetical protein K501DRAFT_278084 [Backusella circina FSU 941]|nr:hypothetical protein K501DRAFT_278084 [Backusella circina FSU 941]
MTHVIHFYIVIPLFIVVVINISASAVKVRDHFGISISLCFFCQLHTFIPPTDRSNPIQSSRIKLNNCYSHALFLVSLLVPTLSAGLCIEAGAYLQQCFKDIGNLFNRCLLQFLPEMVPKKKSPLYAMLLYYYRISLDITQSLYLLLKQPKQSKTIKKYQQQQLQLQQQETITGEPKRKRCHLGLSHRFGKATNLDNANLLYKKIYSTKKCTYKNNLLYKKIYSTKTVRIQNNLLLKEGDLCITPFYTIPRTEKWYSHHRRIYSVVWIITRTFKNDLLFDYLCPELFYIDTFII